MIRTDRELQDEDLEALTSDSLHKRMLSLLFPLSEFKKYDLVESSSAKITLQAVRYILERDFPLPKLQIFILDKLDRQMTRRDFSGLKTTFPDLKTYGRFSVFEDSVLVKRLARLIQNLCLSSKQGWKMMSACFDDRSKSKTCKHYILITLPNEMPCNTIIVFTF